MKSVADLFSWLLDKDIRTKNAASALVALLGVVILFFVVRRTQWFQDLERFGAAGIVVPLVVAFLIAFLMTWIIWTAIENVHNGRRNVQRMADAADQREVRIQQTLDTLSQRQWQIIGRFVNAGESLLHESEIGEYNITWQPEAGVLVTKGVLIRHRAGMWEIAPHYWNWMRANLPPG